MIRISLVPFRAFRTKPVTGQELFFAVSYSKPALDITTSKKSSLKGWNFRFSLLKHVEDFRVNALLGNPQEAPRPWGVSAGTTLRVHYQGRNWLPNTGWAIAHPLVTPLIIIHLLGNSSFYFEGEILIVIKTKFLSLLLIFIRKDKGYLLSHECLVVSVHQFFQPPMLVFC